MLKDAIAHVAGVDVKLVDSGETVADAAAKLLAEGALMRASGEGDVRFLATDGPERFARVGSLFLGEAIDAADVELVDL